MPATVVRFPDRRATVPYREPPSQATRPRVIRFPDPRDSLTAHDVGVLAALTARTRWYVETTRDDNWDLSAIVAGGRVRGAEYAAFLVCRNADTLRLIDARLSAFWQTLGVFPTVEELAGALRPMLDPGAAAVQQM